MPIWLADLRTSLVLDKLLQIVRLYTPPGTPATRQPGNAATPHFSLFLFLYPTVDDVVPSPPRRYRCCCIIAHVYIHVCVMRTSARVAEESSRKIASFVHDSSARPRALLSAIAKCWWRYISLPLNRRRFSLRRMSSENDWRFFDYATDPPTSGSIRATAWRNTIAEICVGSCLMVVSKSCALSIALHFLEPLQLESSSRKLIRRRYIHSFWIPTKFISYYISVNLA